MATPTTPNAPLQRSIRLGLRAVVFGVLWWVVTEARADEALPGLLLAPLAAALSLALNPGPLLVVRPAGALRFVAFFAVESVKGGLDVAARALSPRIRLAPACLDYRLRLHGDGPRVVFANVLSLLPGTLAARLRDETLEVHVLDASSGAREGIARVEERVADLFGISLEGGGA